MSPDLPPPVPMPPSAPPAPESAQTTMVIPVVRVAPNPTVLMPAVVVPGPAVTPTWANWVAAVGSGVAVVAVLAAGALAWLYTDASRAHQTAIESVATQAGEIDRLRQEAETVADEVSKQKAAIALVELEVKEASDRADRYDHCVVSIEFFLQRLIDNALGNASDQQYLEALDSMSNACA